MVLGILLNNLVIWVLIVWVVVLVRNYIFIVCVENVVGVSFVVMDKLIGDRYSFLSMMSRKLRMS